MWKKLLSFYRDDKVALFSHVSILLLVSFTATVYFLFPGKKYGGFNQGFQVAQPYTVTSPSAGAAATTTNFIGSILPQESALYDLGSLTKKWRDIFTAGSVSSTRFYAGDGALGTPSFTFTAEPGMGAYRSGGGSYRIQASTEIDLYNSSGNAVTLISGAFRSLGTNNTISLGGGAFAWSNVYASGSLFIGAGSVGSPSINFAGTNNSGWYGNGAGSIGLSLNGAGPYVSFAPNANGLQMGLSITDATNNAHDLGKFGGAFHNIYASGTLLIANQRTVNPSANTSTVWAGDLSHAGQVCYGDMDGSGATCTACNNGSCSTYSTSTY